MKRSKFTEEQVVRILKEADAGGTVKDLCRRHGIATATYYQWKSKCGTTIPPETLGSRIQRLKRRSRP